MTCYIECLRPTQLLQIDIDTVIAVADPADTDETASMTARYVCLIQTVGVAVVM